MLKVCRGQEAPDRVEAETGQEGSSDAVILLALADSSKNRRLRLSMLG